MSSSYEQPMAVRDLYAAARDLDNFVPPFNPIQISVTHLKY